MKRLAISFLLITLSSCGLTKYNQDIRKFYEDEASWDFEGKLQTINKGTQVHIVGTVHYETENIKRQDIYAPIDRITPSIILYEGSERDVKRILNRNTEPLLRLIKSFKNRKDIERPLALKYIRKHPSSIVLPYDWELKNQYFRKHKLRKKSKEMINALLKLNREGILNSDQSDIVKQFLEYHKALIEIEKDATLEDINNYTTDSIVQQRQAYIYKKLPDILNQSSELPEFKDFLPIHMAYWDMRNKAMVQNILKHIKAHPNKVIVVLNGFYHRYYLINELKKYEAEYEFSIK